LQRRGAIGSTMTSINLLYTSADGKVWRQHPVPAAYAGHDVVLLTSFIYKGCLCRVGVRSWIIVNSLSLTGTSSKYLSLAGPLTLETDRPRACRSAVAVFDEPCGRWYGTTPDVISGNILQREPAWAVIGNAGAKINVTNGKLNTLRNVGQAAIATCGTRLGMSYRLLMKLKATHATSVLRIGAEAGLNLGLHIEGNVSLLRLAQTADAGVAYVNDAISHQWELRRDEIIPSSSEALLTTGSSTAGSRIVQVASSAGITVETAVRLVGAGVAGSDIDTVCDGVPNGTSISVPGNLPLTLAGFQVRATRWKMSALRDGVMLSSYLFSEAGWGGVKVFASGSADLQGWEIEWLYLLPVNAPVVVI
jgi:hypothetical protein